MKTVIPYKLGIIKSKLVDWSFFWIRELTKNYPKIRKYKTVCYRVQWKSFKIFISITKQRISKKLFPKLTDVLFDPNKIFVMIRLLVKMKRHYYWNLDIGIALMFWHSNDKSMGFFQSGSTNLDSYVFYFSLIQQVLDILYVS